MTTQQDAFSQLTDEYKKTGGYAHPQTITTHGLDVHHAGLTIRDYFAGEALTGVIQTVNETGSRISADMYPKVVATACYAIADAMIEARNK